jgi:hypothetical protein
MKYVIVQRTGFIPYFLSAWRDGTDCWVHLRSHARVFDGRAARLVAKQLNARYSAVPHPVTVEIA